MESENDVETTIAYESVAFISYSRRDLKTAKRLQQGLEWYRVPPEFQSAWESSKGIKYIRPVVLDKTDLNVRVDSYWNEIEHRISNARFLIVLCSPNSATSEYVDREIRHFLASRPNALQALIPVIVAGSIKSPDHALECFPPSLREVEDALEQRNLPTAINATHEEMLLQTIAFMLGADFSAIHDRYQRTKRKHLRRWLAASVGVTLLFASIATYAVFQFLEARAQREAAVAERDRANMLKDIADTGLHEALLRSARAFAANQFLSWLLESDQVTMADAIRSAATAMDEGAFKDRPVVEAGLRLSIGKTLLESGHLDEADRQLTRAVALFQKYTGPETGGIEEEELKLAHSDVQIARKAEFLYGDELANSLSELAQLRLAQKKPKEGEPLISQAINLIHPAPDASPLLRLRALNSQEPPTTIVFFRSILAEIQAAENKDAEAETSWKEAIIDGRTLTSKMPMVGACLDLGQFYNSRNKASDANAVYKQALADLSSDAKDTALERGEILAALARNDATSGNGADAERCFREALALLRPFFESEHSAYAGVVADYKSFLANCNRLDECEKLCRDDLEFIRKSEKARDFDFMISLSTLATVLAQEGKIEEAEPLLREAITRGNSLPPDSEILVSIRTLLSRCLGKTMRQICKAGPCMEAESILRERVQLFSQTLLPAEEPLEICKTELLFAQVLELAGKRQEQEENLRHAVDLGRQVWPDGSPELATALNDLGTCLRDRNSLDEAAQFAGEALDMSIKVLPPQSLDIAISERNFGLVLLMKGKLDQAFGYLNKAVALARQTMADRDPRKLQMELDLASALMEQHSYKDAEPILREILAPREAAPDTSPTQIDSFAGALLQELLRDTGRVSEAKGVPAKFGVEPFVGAQ